MHVIHITDTDRSLWEKYVDSSPMATGYHRFGWKDVIEESFGHHCYYLAAVDENGTYEGVLPLVHMKSRIFGNFLVSVPFVNYGGVLWSTHCARDCLLSEAETIRKSCRADHLELRHLGQGIGDLPTRQHKVTMILPLAPDVDAQWTAFNAKLRNQVRKAEKSGLMTTLGHVELLDDFYDVFARNMRDLGTPVYSKAFFLKVLQRFSETTKIIKVTLGGKTIAAGIASWFRDTVEVPWASSISDYKACCPNNMLYWDAIRFAIGNSFTKFDFGRSTSNEGTFNFKKQWGAEPVALHWQYLLEEGCPLPDINPANPKYDLAIKIWKKLPLAVTRVLGPHIVRNIP